MNISAWIPSVLRKGFAKDVAVVSIGTAVSQALLLLASPVLSRLYTPEDFGYLGAVMAAIGIVSVVASFRLEAAIVLPEKEGEARALYSVSLISLLSVSVLAFPALFLGSYFSDYLGKMGWMFFLSVPAGIFLAGYMQILNMWNIRHRGFAANSVSRIAGACTNILIGMLVGWKLSGPVGLILGYQLGMLASIVLLLFRSPVQPPLAISHSQDMRSAVTVHRRFPMVNAPHVFVETLYELGIIFFIAYFFSNEMVGHYAFAFRIIKAPVSLVGNSISQVFYQRATEAKRNDTPLLPVFSKLLWRIAALGVIPFTLLFFFGAPIFQWAFGTEWEEAGHFASIMAPWIFLNFIASPFSSLAMVFGQQKTAFALTLTDLAIRFVMLFIGGYRADAELAIILTSVAGAVMMFVGICWYYLLVKRNGSGEAP